MHQNPNAVKEESRTIMDKILFKTNYWKNHLMIHYSNKANNLF